MTFGERREPMKRGKPMKRTAMKRKPPKVTNAGKPRHAWTGIKRGPKDGHRWPPSVVAEVHERSGGMCEARIMTGCTGRGQHLHHRKRAGQGGPDTAVNALHVCFVCHSVGIHGQMAGRAILRGMLLPASTPNDAIPPYEPWTGT